MTSEKHAPGFVPGQGFIQEDWDEVSDNPEITDEQWATARPAREVLPPALYEALTKRGRPLSLNKRVQVTLRLDPEAVAAFRATGPGWQGLINEAVVREAAKLEQA